MLKAWLFTLAGLLFLRFFVFTPFLFESSATQFGSEFVLGVRSDCLIAECQFEVGQIVVLHSTSRAFRRVTVVGLPGDVLQVNDHRFVRNGEVLDLGFKDEQVLLEGELRVPSRRLWVVPEMWQGEEALKRFLVGFDDVEAWLPQPKDFVWGPVVQNFNQIGKLLF